jgi:hypothetical protein
MRTEVNQTRINGKYPTGSVYYFGIAYPVREVNGYKVSTERLEARLEFDGSLLMEAAGMLEEFACFLSDEDIHALSDKEILEIIHS